MGTYVHVIKPIGELTVARATADVFTRDHELTITALDDRRVQETFPASAWIRAAVVDDEGWTQFVLENPEAPTRLGEDRRKTSLTR